MPNPVAVVIQERVLGRVVVLGGGRRIGALESLQSEGLGQGYGAFKGCPNRIALGCALEELGDEVFSLPDVVQIERPLVRDLVFIRARDDDPMGT